MDSFKESIFIHLFLIQILQQDFQHFVQDLPDGCAVRIGHQDQTDPLLRQQSGVAPEPVSLPPWLIAAEHSGLIIVPFIEKDHVEIITDASARITPCLDTGPVTENLQGPLRIPGRY